MKVPPFVLAARVSLDIGHQGKNDELRILCGNQDDIADIGRILEIHQFFQFVDEFFHTFTVPLPPARQAIIDAGGLIPYARRLLLERPAR